MDCLKHQVYYTFLKWIYDEIVIMLVIVNKHFLSSTIPFAFLKGGYTEIQVRKVKNQGGSASGLEFFCFFSLFLKLY